MLTPRQVEATIDSIAAAQLADGCIPWFEGGHADPWDHVEAAMALDLGGRRVEAERAYEWLQKTQDGDGAWAFYYIDGRVEEPNRDANQAAYVATGTWHHFLVTQDIGFLEDMWSTVERAIAFVLGLQAPGGEIYWSRLPDGTPAKYALLTASSSVHHSLRCAIAIAERLNHERPDWELSLGLLSHAITHRPEAFEPKDRFSMDWYYPVLGGAVTGEAAKARLRERWDAFVVPGRGARCVSDQPWVTAAETCELVMALDVVGLDREARQLFEWVQYLRAPDGSYWTGHNYVYDQHYPEGERTSWTAAANVLANDVLERTSTTSGIFRGDGLPIGLDVEETEPAADIG